MIVPTVAGCPVADGAFKCRQEVCISLVACWCMTEYVRAPGRLREEIGRLHRVVLAFE